MAAEYGFVYVLTNDSMPGIFKVGSTTKHPMARIAELSRATGCPEPFELAAYFGTCDPQRIEFEIHKALHFCRVNTSREFFRLSLDAISGIFDQYADDYADAVYRRRLDNLISLEDYERGAAQ